MIKKTLFIVFISMVFISCGSSKNVASTTKKTRNHTKKSVATDEVSIADKVVWTAVTYKGVPYRYGGTTDRGMDCSGLIHTSFKKRDIDIPRTSHLMYNAGFPIHLREVKRGDLLFFKTSKKRGRVNHVGLVTSVDANGIKFIHSTSSRGVIVTSLNEHYWNRAFVKAKRVL